MNRYRLISILLFIAGLCIFLYPSFTKLYYELAYQEEVKQVEAFFESGDADDLYAEQVTYNAKTISNDADIEVANVSYSEVVEGDKSNSDVIAILKIPSMNLEYPIYDGATEENLNRGVARIEGTSYPVGGLNTNTVIAGHNGLVDRTYFSHIKDLQMGDQILVQNAKETLVYEVYATAIINPDEVEALTVVPGQDTLTLLTCTWPPPGTQRYLVYAKRVG